MQSGPPGAAKVSTTSMVCRSILLMVLATRLLTSKCRLSPMLLKACAPSAVLMVLLRLASLPLTSYTSTLSPPVSATRTNLSSAVPYTSAGTEPVGVRHLMVWLARSIATSSLLSCMVE